MDGVIRFVVEGEPASQPKQRYFDAKSAIGMWRGYTREAALKAMQKVGLQAIQGVVAMRVVWVFTRAGKRWKTKPMPRVPKMTKPDNKNLLTAIEDACKGIVFGDDRQIVWHELLKMEGQARYDKGADRFELERARAVVEFMELPKEWDGVGSPFDVPLVVPPSWEYDKGAI